MTGDYPLTGAVKPICNRMWSVTPYAKCDLKCLYCCTLVQGESAPTQTPANEIFEQIMALPSEDTVIFGAFSDAYPNAEATHGITRAILAKLAHVGRPVTIVTKGTTLLRDMDLLKKLEQKVLVQISIATLDDSTALQMEPGAPSISERLDMLWQLHTAGVRIEVNALPWIPGISDLAGLVSAIPDGTQVNVAPLAPTSERNHQRLLGRVYARDEIISAYLEERARLSRYSQLSWVRPAKEGHHHPMNRFDKEKRQTAKTQEPVAVTSYL